MLLAGDRTNSGQDSAGQALKRNSSGKAFFPCRELGLAFAAPNTGERGTHPFSCLGLSRALRVREGGRSPTAGTDQIPWTISRSQASVEPSELARGGGRPVTPGPVGGPRRQPRGRGPAGSADLTGWGWGPKPQVPQLPSHGPPSGPRTHWREPAGSTWRRRSAGWSRRRVLTAGREAHLGDQRPCLLATFGRGSHRGTLPERGLGSLLLGL